MKARQQLTMQAVPYAGHLPVPKTPPAGDARSAAHFLRQHLQGMPVSSTNRIPVRAARSEHAGDRLSGVKE